MYSTTETFFSVTDPETYVHFKSSRIEFFFDTAPWCYDFGDEIPYFTQAKFRKFHHVDTLWQKSTSLPI